MIDLHIHTINHQMGYANCNQIKIPKSLVDDWINSVLNKNNGGNIVK